MDDFDSIMEEYKRYCRSVDQVNVKTLNGNDFENKSEGKKSDEGCIHVGEKAKVIQPKVIDNKVNVKSFDTSGFKNKLKKGATIEFGTYPQGANGEVKPIEWQVLSWDGNTALLLSKYILEARSFDDKMKTNIWRDCTMRVWLNGDFYNKAFSSEEKKFIKSTELTTTDCNGKIPVNTTDKIFLLSYYDVQSTVYGFEKGIEKSKTRQAIGTDYAKVDGLNKSIFDGGSSWWCRSAGYYSYKEVTAVRSDGNISRGWLTDSSRNGVRPALYFEL